MNCSLSAADVAEADMMALDLSATIQLSDSFGEEEEVAEYRFEETECKRSKLGVITGKFLSSSYK